MTITNRLATTTLFLIAMTGSAHAASVTNGSFETGDLTGWTAIDISDPFETIAARQEGTLTAFDGFLGSSVVLPSDGLYALSHGFDGGGGTIRLEQEIGVVGANDVLSFDYRAGWDMLNFFGSTMDREFIVRIEDVATASPLLSSTQLVAAAMTAEADTGPLSGSIDLSGLAGANALLVFEWTVPEFFTGPANFQLDNIAISQVPLPAALPLAASAFGLLLTLGRRRKSQ